MRKWDIRKIKNRLSEWVAMPDNKERMLDKQIRDIGQKMGSADPAQTVGLGSSLKHISVWEAKNGALAVLNEDSGGWLRLAKAAVYHFWGCRIVLFFYDADTRSPKPPRENYNRAALCFAQLLALGYKDEASWIGERLARGLSDGAFFEWLPDEQFSPFVVCLYRLWHGESPDEGFSREPNIEAYRQIVDSWSTGGDALKNGLLSACDYHMQRIDYSKDDHEFYNEVYAAFPLEILAIEQIRKGLGMETPQVEHPLMKTPLAFPPAGPLFVSDELLDSILGHLPMI